MKASIRLPRVVVAVAMIIAGVAASASGVAAQGSPKPDFEPDYFESMLTGFEIRISNDSFVIDDVYQQNYVDGENELIYISSETSLMEVSLFDDEDSPSDTIDMWVDLLASEMDDFNVVDQGDDGDVAWVYAVGTLDSDEFEYFVQTEAGVHDDIYLLESVLTFEGNLVDAVDEAQQAISIDGDPFMDDVDLDELEGLVNSQPFRDATPADAGDDEDDESTRDRSRGDDDDDPGDQTDSN